MDIECNTCKHYNPMDGLCRITGEYQHGYDDCHALDKNENLMWESEHDTDRDYVKPVTESATDWDGINCE